MIDDGFARQRKISGYVIAVIALGFLVGAVIAFIFVGWGWGLLFGIIGIVNAYNAWRLLEPKPPG